MPDKLMSASRFIATFAEESGFTPKQARSALNTLNAIVAQQLGTQGPGQVLIPGLLKLIVVDKPATAQHEGIDPVTQKAMTYAAKAAHKVIRIRPLKALRDAV